MGRRILIVEDEPAFAEVLTELLVDEGYSVVHVRDGVSALNVISGSGSRHRLDMVVSDVMLPGLRGDRFAAEVRARFPNRRLPILLMSASADPHVTLSDVSFLPKPFDTAELLDQIRTMIAPPSAPSTAAAGS